MRMAESLASAQYGNHLMEELIAKKCLQFNLDKSSFIVMGTNKQRKQFQRELEKSPLTLCDQKMKEVKTLKFLGDHLSFSLEDSVHQTVLKRVGIAKHTVLEIRTVIEDIRADRLGSINVAFNIFEQAILPMVLHNSETWLNITRKTMRILDDLFHYFCRTIFRIHTGCPKPSFYWESGSLKIENIILEKKLNFLFHLANLSIDSLGRQFFDLQEEDSSLPSLLKECREHIDQIGLNFREVSKWQYKRKVKSYIKKRNKNQLLEEIRGYKKLNHDELSIEPFERKSYFSCLSLTQARMRFRVASSFVPTVRGDFSRKYRHKSLSCPGCSKTEQFASPPVVEGEPGEPQTSLSSVSTNQPAPRDSISHILVCKAYSDIRSSIELDHRNDEKLANFFIQVVQRRIDNGDD